VSGWLRSAFLPDASLAAVLANRLLGERASRRLVDVLQPGFRLQAGRLGKFRAYYRWCEGPTARQHRRFASMGFEVIDYVVFVGHEYYKRFPVIQRATDGISHLTVRLRQPIFSTYAVVVLRRSVT